MDGVPNCRFSFDAIGTRFEIDTPQPLSTIMRERVLELTEDFDRLYSRFRDTSLIAEIAAAKGGGVFAFPPDAAVMFDLYDRLHTATDGAVDPLVGADLERLGYDRSYSLVTSDSAPCPALQRPAWNLDVTRHGATLTTGQPLTIDLGALGKGRLVDLIANLLNSKDIEDFLVDGSGDMRHRGNLPVTVGLEDPRDPSRVIGIATLADGALCASAVNRRAWGDGLHHVVDGRTGRPTHDVIATWAVAADAATADGLATALFFAPAARLRQAFDFSFVRLFADGRAEVSDNFDGEVFTEKGH